MKKSSTLILLIMLLVACSNNEVCNNEASFDRWDLQQTWFHQKDIRDFENKGAIFDEKNGDIFHPIEIINFEYCVSGMTIYISREGWFENILTPNYKVEIIQIDNKTMTLLFPNGDKFTYYRNE